MKIDKQLLTINQYSRPNIKLLDLRGLVVHWVNNPMTSAEANRNFFELRKDGKYNYGSAHYIIGLYGEIIQSIPDNEMAYHVGAKNYTKKALKELSHYPNNCTLGIECCHVNESGIMTTETYNSLTNLILKLCKDNKLNENNLYLHYDITKKNCHKWFVDNPDKWNSFKQEIQELLVFS